MSLAMFAAPFDENTDMNNDNSESNLITKKRQAHNKTQKKYPKENFDTNKVNSMLAKIHNSTSDDESEDKNKETKKEPEYVQKTITLSSGLKKVVWIDKNADINDYYNF